MVDVTAAEVFICRSCHLEIFAEEHDLQCSVSAMADLDHLEREVLPGCVDANADERNEQAEKAHPDRLLSGRWLIGLQPLEHVVYDAGQD